MPVLDCWCICACKMEKELKSEISALEGQTGKKLTVEGKPFDIYVRHQWDSYHTQKELEKQHRVCSLDFILRYNDMHSLLEAFSTLTLWSRAREGI